MYREEGVEYHLYALYQYRFDNLSFEILLSNGLVSFLVGVLKNIITDKSVYHINHDDEETLNTSIYSKRRSSSQKAKLKSDELFNYKSSSFNRQAKMTRMDPYGSAPESPESGSSGYNSNGNLISSSSGSSPARNDENDEDDIEDDAIYSPVCSDAEDDPAESPAANSVERIPSAMVVDEENTGRFRTGGWNSSIRIRWLRC